MAPADGVELDAGLAEGLEQVPGLRKVCHVLR